MRLPGRNKARRPEPGSSSTASARTKVAADLVNPDTGAVVGRIETTVGELMRRGLAIEGPHDAADG